MLEGVDQETRANMNKKFFLTGASGFIGTNLVFALERAGASVVNFDKARPFFEGHSEYWVNGDIFDKHALAKAIDDFGPDSVVHLAARTDCVETTTVETGYRVNTEGTRSLLECVDESPSVKRLIIVSSQFVCGPKRLPNNEEDYFPHTVYGKSKVVSEKLTREIDPRCCWTIVRPTNVWGPYHDRYSREFWKIVTKGLYFHPDIPTPTRSYGYVGNVVEQMLGILGCAEEEVAGKVFYVGDPPIDIIDWIDGFHNALKGKRARRVPLPIVQGMAKFGDAISAISGKPFYINSSRLRSMMTDYPAPMEATFDLLGAPKYSLEAGIDETARWYMRQGRKGVS